MIPPFVQRGSYPRSKMLLLAALLPYALLTGRVKLHGLEIDAPYPNPKEAPEPFDGEEAVQRLLDKLVVRKLIRRMVEGQGELPKTQSAQGTPTEATTASSDLTTVPEGLTFTQEYTMSGETVEYKLPESISVQRRAANDQQEQVEEVGIATNFWDICKLWFLGQCGFNTSL